MFEIDIIPKHKFKPSTVTIRKTFNININIFNLSNYLPIYHIFDKEGNRIKLISGSRKSIEYYGPEKSVISICFKDIRRGMRTGAMNNMVSLDIQKNGKNIHLKVSSSAIISVGTSSLKEGENVFNTVINHIEEIQKKINFIKSLDKEVVMKNILIFVKILEGKDLIPLSEIQELVQKTTDINKELVNIFLLYYQDFDKNQTDNYIKKINSLYGDIDIFEGELKCSESNIFNSVFYTNCIKNIRVPLHLLAQYLSSFGIIVNYDNRTSEGVVVCFNVEEQKTSYNYASKEYKHRFTIHMNGKIKQTSPSKQEEAHKYYFGLMNLIKKFFEKKDIDFKQYLIK